MTEARAIKQPELLQTACPICGPGTDETEIYRATFTASALNAATFSARRSPDRVHYRMVRCKGCRLVRSNPVVSEDVRIQLYGESTLDYSSEIPNLVTTYSRYMALAQSYLDRPSRMLEIGCGNGFMLEEGLRLGFTDVVGVEPSRDAVRQAVDGVRDKIVVGMMGPGMFEPSSFDLVCMFQTLDHIADPAVLLTGCRTALRPGGVLLALHHNVDSWSARLLGERSPIFDIEHMHLYSPQTIRRLLARAGFEPLDVGTAVNRLSMRHLGHLFPVSPGVRRRLAPLLRPAGRVTVKLPLGNLYAIGRRPLSDA